jgi:uncharacterized protein DUF6790
MTNAPTAPRNRFLGLLPFIGVVLFVGAEIAVYAATGGVGFLRASVVNAVLFLIGAAGLSNGVVHLLFASSILKSIGWAKSPLQFEIGGANLAIGIAGILAVFFGPEYWFAVILINLVFLVTVGVGHILEIRSSKSLSSNLVAPILVLDFVLPILCLVLWIVYVMTPVAVVVPPVL